MPSRYSTEAALATMAEAFEEACTTMREFQDILVREMRRPGATFYGVI